MLSFLKHGIRNINHAWYIDIVQPTQQLNRNMSLNNVLSKQLLSLMFIDLLVKFVLHSFHQIWTPVKVLEALM